MTKFIYESEELRNVGKALNNADKSFDIAADAAGSLDIPDFSYSGWLSGLADMINNCKSSVMNDNEWVLSAYNLLENCNSESVSAVEGIEVHSNFDKSTQVNVV